MIHFEPTKTAKSSGAEVDIPVTPEITAVLERARTLAKVKPGPGGDAFVIQSRSGSPYTHFGISSAIERAAIAVGLAKRKARPRVSLRRISDPTPRARLRSRVTAWRS